MWIICFIGKPSWCGNSKDLTVQVKNNSTVKLSVVICGNPEPNVTWIVDGKPYHDSTKEKNSRGNFTYSVEFALPFKSKSVSYIVEWSNKPITDSTIIKRNFSLCK